MNSLFSIKYKNFFLKIKVLGIKLDLSAYSIAFFVRSILRKYNYIAIYRILKEKNDNVVVIELNDFHCEVLPSWKYHLKKLGNKTLFLVHPKIYDENPFYNEIFNVIKIDYNYVLFLINLGFLFRYKRIIFNSDYIYERPFGGRSFLYNMIKFKYIGNILFLSHHANLTIENKGLTSSKKIITLSRAVSNKTNIHYFFPKLNSSNIATYNKLKRIIIVGNMKHISKDYKGLLLALEKLKSKKQPSFSLDLVGKIHKNLPRSDFINYHNRLNFKELHSLLTKSHFILFLLKKTEGHQYKSTDITGSFLLALNFGLIPVLEDSFQGFYELDESNSVVYNEINGISNALDEISNMSKTKYTKLQVSLSKLTKNLEKDSLRNSNI